MKRKNLIGVIQGTSAELTARANIDPIGYVYMPTDATILKFSDAIHPYSTLKGISILSIGKAADVAAIVDNTGGTPNGSTLAVVTLPSLSTWNGSTAVSAADATAIKGAITSITNDLAGLALNVNAILTAVKASNEMA